MAFRKWRRAEGVSLRLGLAERIVKAAVGHQATGPNALEHTDDGDRRWASTGCATPGSKTAYRGYCSTTTHESCPALEGAGDCQPCPPQALSLE